ncbi:MAG: DUF2141 domain-containing protein [Deltaproteobacteria bacterium]|nr:DUF2141 domain-containing protein [Deltaproteobacteria bacterium]
MILAVSTAFAVQGSSRLTIHITGFENSDGVAKIAIVNSKKNYNAETPFKGFNLKIINKEVIKTILLPYGEYALKVFHDENGNNELDTRIFGIPTERYGFSNNARGTLGPPEYEEAVFKLYSPKKKITITIQ